MKFTFLMCVNRMHRFLADAIDSVLEQSDEDFEFFIVANNCEDALLDYLRSFRDQRIKVFRTGIGQLAYNLNYGLDQIESGYLLRMDGDDVSLSYRLSETRKWLAEKNYPQVIGSDVIVIDESGNQLDYLKVPHSNMQIRRALWRGTPFVHPACAIDVGFLKSLGGYSGGFKSEDYDLWLRVARNPDTRFFNMTKPVIKYRTHEDQAGRSSLGYSEVSGYLMREAVLSGNVGYAVGSVYAALKRVFKAKKS